MHQKSMAFMVDLQLSVFADGSTQREQGKGKGTSTYQALTILSL